MRLHYSNLIIIPALISAQTNNFQEPKQAKKFIKIAGVRVNNQVRDRSRIGKIWEERFDTDDVDQECTKAEQCAYEEISELMDDKVEAQKKYDSYAKQCWTNRCNAQGTGICINKWNERKCVCKNGWKGGDCSEDIDECKIKVEGSDSKRLVVRGKYCNGLNEICINTDGSYSCECQNGYERDSNNTCTDTDECAYPDACGEHGSCVNSPGGFNCKCFPGFDRDENFKCNVDIDECEFNDCESDETCKNTVGSYECVKNHQALSLDTGSGLETNTEEPTTTPEPTTTEIKTTTEVSSSLAPDYQGSPNPNFCGEGYKYDLNAYKCVDMDECNDFCGLASYDPVHCHEPVCGANSRCINTPGSYSCEKICQNSDCPEFSRCDLDGECQCEVNTLDTSKYGIQHPKLTEKCISDTMEQIEFMNWYFKNEGGNDEPRFIIGQDSACPKGFSPQTEHWSGETQCLDIDECESNNGRGPCTDGCVNYFGGYNCVHELSEENKNCHHYAVTPFKKKIVGEWEFPTCACFTGYKLCEDQWTCTCSCGRGCNKRKRRSTNITRKYGFKKHNPNDRNRQLQAAPISLRAAGIGGPSGISHCPAGQIEIVTGPRKKYGCYKIFDKETDRASLEDAKEKCISVGGKLATITHRQEWWNVMRAVKQGWFSFWIDEASGDYIYPPTGTRAEDGAQIKLLNTYRLDANYDGGIIANMPNDYRMVPPQWNVVDRRQKHRFVCEM